MECPLYKCPLYRDFLIRAGPGKRSVPRFTARLIGMSALWCLSHRDSTVLEIFFSFLSYRDINDVATFRHSELISSRNIEYFEQYWSRKIDCSCYQTLTTV